MVFRRVLLVAMIVASTVVGAAAPTSATPYSGVADPDHPFSEPTWSPVRNSVQIACAKTNCPGPYHDYDAIDLVGDLGDPIYAAGAGVFHIGSTDRTCPTSGPTAGVWVWIDHGPAGRSRYSHLDTIEATEGQLVTPGTLIGTMGSTGQKAPCETNYLHFEYRTATNSSTRIPVPSLRACIDGDTVLLPNDLGYPTWDDVPAGPIPVQDRVHTPDTDSSCFPSTWSDTPDQPTVVVEPGVERIDVQLSNRSPDVDEVRVRLEQYHPTIEGYGSTVDKTLSPSKGTTTFTGLTPNKTYRVIASFHNSAGWSAWSDDAVAVPGSLPTPPTLREIDATITTLGYKWNRVPGANVEYDVRIRRADGVSWGPWTTYPVEAPAINYRFRELQRDTTYQVSSRARNEFGVSDWAPGESITTLGCQVDCDAAGPQVFTPLEPARFADSRDEATFDGQYRHTGQRPGGTNWEIQIAGRGNVPTDATAAIVNLTVLNGIAPGYATVYPCGSLPTASSVNYGPGSVDANEVIAKLSATGTVCVFTLTAADVVLDVVGHVSDSPYRPLVPTRYADSRDEQTFDDGYRNTGPRGGGTTWEIQIAGRGDVPASAATAAVNVTVTGGTGPGFATVFPCGAPPVASSLNYDVGLTRPNELLVKLSSSGTICVYTLTEVDVIVDVVGYTDDVVGFTPLAPVRMADSRDETTVDGQHVATGIRAGGSTWTIQIDGRAGVRDAAAVVANVTVTGTRAPGFLTIYACGDVPTASSVNYGVGTTRPNETIAQLSETGTLCVYTLSDAHIIVDVVGFVSR